MLVVAKQCNSNNSAGGSGSTVQSEDSKADIDDNDGAVANSNK